MIRRIVFALSLGLGLALGLIWLLGSQNSVALADPGILYVAPGGNCGGATPCYTTAQAAVDAANPGDEIRVAEGTYTGVQNVPSLNTATFTATQMVAITKTVTIKGGYTTANWTTPDPAANPTTLDAQGQGRVFYITGDIGPTVEGLRLTGGNAAGLGGYWGYDVGGGVYIDQATASIIGNVIYSNTAFLAGGVFTHWSDSTLSYNAIVSNTSNAEAPGVHLYGSPATLTNNVIHNNVGHGWGGGLYLDSSDATVRDNVVTSNHASYGGGICVYSSSGATVEGNLVSGNTAYRGAGMFVYFSNATLTGNVVTGNASSGTGGGVDMDGGMPTLVNNVVADNEAATFGPGIYVFRSSPHLVHTTLARNGSTLLTRDADGGDGSGIHVTGFEWSGTYYASNVVMTNTILVSQTVGITVTAGNTVTLNATLWHANTTNWDGAGTINHSNDHSGDPAFDTDGYHLTGGSAAIDAGVGTGVTTDIDGEARPQGAGYDIGADEFKMWQLYLPIVLKMH